MSKCEMAYNCIQRWKCSTRPWQSVLCTSLSLSLKWRRTIRVSKRAHRWGTARQTDERESEGVEGESGSSSGRWWHHTTKEREQKQGLSNWVCATFHQRIQQIIQFRIRHTRKFWCRARRVCWRQTALKGLFNNNYISAQRSHLITACRSILWPLRVLARRRIRVNHLNARCFCN